MPDLGMIARWVFFAGLGLIAFAGILWLISRIPGIENFPGTIKIQSGGLTCVFPLLLSIILSVLLTIGLNIIIRMLKK